MKHLIPIQKITTKKQLRLGLLIGFRIANNSFGYAVADNDYGGLWLLNVRTEGQLYIPSEFPEPHAKWNSSQGYNKVDRDMWGIAHEECLPERLTCPVHINRGGMDGSWHVFSPEGLRLATEEDLRTIPIVHRANQIGEFAEMHFNELELVNSKFGWTMVPPEKLAAAKRASRPKPLGEYRIEIFVNSFEGTEIASRMDLEEDIKEAIQEHGFVSGGGSLVGASGEEGGHVDIECNIEDLAAVIRGINDALKACKAPPGTVITEICMMDDGSEKTKDHLFPWSLDIRQTKHHG
jgi:hypothetical protein